MVSSQMGYDSRLAKCEKGHLKNSTPQDYRHPTGGGLSQDLGVGLKKIPLVGVLWNARYAEGFGYTMSTFSAFLPRLSSVRSKETL